MSMIFSDGKASARFHCRRKERKGVKTAKLSWKSKRKGAERIRGGERKLKDINRKDRIRKEKREMKG